MEAIIPKTPSYCLCYSYILCSSTASTGLNKLLGETSAHTCSLLGIGCHGPMWRLTLYFNSESVFLVEIRR